MHGGWHERTAWAPGSARASSARKTRPLLTGKGRFVDDIQLPGMLHAAFARSAHAHARIRGIDAAAARACPACTWC